MTRVPAVLGPTAVGKSRVAFELALALGREIVVADSRQVYRRLEIATNKPLPEERTRVRYHGLDLAEPEGGFNVHQYVAAVAPVLASRPVVVEGGSNLYVDAYSYSNGDSYADPDADIYSKAYANSTTQPGTESSPHPRPSAVSMMARSSRR